MIWIPKIATCGLFQMIIGFLLVRRPPQDLHVIHTYTKEIHPWPPFSLASYSHRQYCPFLFSYGAHLWSSINWSLHICLLPWNDNAPLTLISIYNLLKYFIPINLHDKIVIQRWSKNQYLESFDQAYIARKHITIGLVLSLLLTLHYFDCHTSIYGSKIWAFIRVSK